MSIKMEKRRLAIVRYVESHGSCRLETLAQQLNVSVQTIRSDIRFLNESGRVFRTHGGIGAYQRENIGYSSRERQHLVQKEAIGKEAAKLLNGVNSCALGTGSTVEMLAKALQREDPLHVCTNNFHTLIHLCDKPPIVLTVAGGRVRKRDQDVIGGDALLFFKRYRTEIGIVSVGAMSKAGELYDYNDDEVMARQALVVLSKRQCC